MYGKLFAAAAVALLAVPQESDQNTYILKSQQVLTGKVLSVNGDKVNLKVSMFGGTAEITRKIDDFTPDTGYLIMLEVSKDTYDDHLRLAKFAADRTLFNPARKEFRAAFEIAEKAKDEAKQKEVETIAADAVERVFKESVAKGNFDMAHKLINILAVRLVNTRTPEQREVLVKMLDDAEQKLAVEKKAAHEAKEAKAEAEERARLLKPLEAKYRQGQQANNDGLVAKNRSSARSNYDTAIQYYVEAYKGLVSLQKSKPNDSVLQETISTLLTDIFSDGVDCCMNASSQLMTQTDFNGAMDYVNRVLKIDPKNEKALAQRSEIQQAVASSGRRWWW